MFITYETYCINCYEEEEKKKKKIREEEREKEGRGAVPSSLEGGEEEENVQLGNKIEKIRVVPISIEGG